MKSIEKPLTIILVLAFLGLVYLWKTERIGDHSAKDVKIETTETDAAEADTTEDFRTIYNTPFRVDTVIVQEYDEGILIREYEAVDTILLY